MGTQMERIRWDVQSEKSRDTKSKGVDPGGAARRAQVCRVKWRGVLSWQHVGKVCGVQRTYKERRSGLLLWIEVW